MAPKQGGELGGPPLLTLNSVINLHALFAFFCKNMSINMYISGLL